MNSKRNSRAAGWVDERDKSARAVEPAGRAIPRSRKLCEESVRIATTRAELEAAYRLVYQRYLTRGYVREHASQVVYQRTFGLPASRTITAHGKDDRLLGTLSLVGDNPLGFRVDEAYFAEVEGLRRKGKRLAEVTCLAIDSDERTTRAEIFVALTRFMIQLALSRGYHDLLIAVHPRHQAFYRRWFNARLVGGCRSYRFAENNPAVCYAIDILEMAQRREDALVQQYLGESIGPSELLKPPMDPRDHVYFCRQVGVSPQAGVDRKDEDAGRDSGRKAA